MASSARKIQSPQSAWAGALCLVFVTMLCSLTLQGILQSGFISGHFLSQGLWQRVVEALDSRVVYDPAVQSDQADPSFWRIFLINVFSGGMVWALGAWAISLRKGIKFPHALGCWGVRGWLWGVVPACWEIGRIISAAWKPESAFVVFLHATAPLWMAIALAGWLATFASLMQKPKPPATEEPKTKTSNLAFWAVIGAALLYTLVLTAMNWQLYRNLLVPHGDSAMYEEHLWNLTHGKGFRSYQEDRLFLGEHLQVVHLLLLPFHWIWPSLMMLDLCESAALAAGAIPIFWMTRRHTDSGILGLLVAGGYLLYFPMQYLDIAIDLKTFRPISFGVPALLFGLDQMERGRMKSALIFWLIALSAKEDYAIILAPLGLWIALFPSLVGSENSSLKTRRTRWLGSGLAVLSTLYLVVAVKYLIPWFRGGEEVHYVGYFQQFGSTLDEVIRNILGNPRLLLSELFGLSSWIFAVSLLVPLGGMALLSPSRLLVALPLFGILCLNEIDRTPHHHFHAPLVPILFWATATGVARFPKLLTLWSQSQSERKEGKTAPQWAAWLVLASAFSTGLFYSMGPLGISFWDPHSPMYWKKRYVISERAEKFSSIADQIPKTARVFSTDFVHPRFTHHRRSYDYSDYPRKTDRELTNPVPGETYFLVIDTQHPYSTIKKPEDIPEYRKNPEYWELLPDKTDGYYIVLKRRRTNSRSSRK